MNQKQRDIKYNLIQSIVDERARQEEKFPNQQLSTLAGISIIAEEFGEASQIVNDIWLGILNFTDEQVKKDLIKELKETATCCLKMMEYISFNTIKYDLQDEG